MISRAGTLVRSPSSCKPTWLWRAPRPTKEFLLVPPFSHQSVSSRLCLPGREFLLVFRGLDGRVPAEGERERVSSHERDGGMAVQVRGGMRWEDARRPSGPSIPRVGAVPGDVPPTYGRFHRTQTNPMGIILVHRALTSHEARPSSERTKASVTNIPSSDGRDRFERFQEAREPHDRIDPGNAESSSPRKSVRYRRGNTE